MSGTELFPSTLWLPCLSSIRLSPVGLVLAILALIVTAVMLRYTCIGLNLRAIGGNPGPRISSGSSPEDTCFSP